MKRSTLALVTPMLAATLALSGCGGGTTGSATTPTTSTTGGTTAGATPGGSASTVAAPAVTCPTESTRSFAKTRFLADVGLAAGTFHRWIYKPYQEGKFTKGADGRTLALAKAVGVAALDVKLLNNAYENVQADPTLCKTIGEPLVKLKNQVNTMKDQITHGDLSSVAGAEVILGSLLGTAKQNGLPVTETTDESTAKL